MQIWASAFKTARCAAHKWTAVGESEAVAACLGGCLVKDQLVWALWERLRCGEMDFYNEKEKGFTSPDLFSLPPHLPQIIALLSAAERLIISQPHGCRHIRMLERCR